MPSTDPFLAIMDQIRDTTRVIQQIQRRIEALPKFTRVNDSIVMCELINRLRSAVMELDRVRSNKHQESYPQSRLEPVLAAAEVKLLPSKPILCPHCKKDLGNLFLLLSQPDPAQAATLDEIDRTP